MITGNEQYDGELTIRQELSARFMAAMLSNSKLAGYISDTELARVACEKADALIAVWNNKPANS